MREREDPAQSTAAELLCRLVRFYRVPSTCLFVAVLLDLRPTELSSLRKSCADIVSRSAALFETIARFDRGFSLFRGRRERIRRRARDRERDQVERTSVLHKHTAHRVMIGNERMDERAAARSGKWKRLPTRCRPLFIISARLAARSAGPAVTWRTCQIGAEFESPGSSLDLRGSRVVARPRGCSASSSTCSRLLFCGR